LRSTDTDALRSTDTDALRSTDTAPRYLQILEREQFYDAAYRRHDVVWLSDRLTRSTAVPAQPQLAVSAASPSAPLN
jgi:hypothetical protein